MLAVTIGATAIAARVDEPTLAAHQIAASMFLFLALVLDALASRKVVVHEPGAHPRDLVGADRRADAAAADRHAALDPSRDHGLRQRHDEVGIVVVRIQRVCAEVEISWPAARRRAINSSFRLNPP